MSDPTTLSGGRTSEDARRLTRRRREERTDHILEINFHENDVPIECPECGETWHLSIHGGVDVMSPSFGPCSSWDCDAFLKIRHDGTERQQATDSATAEQTGLQQFASNGGDHHA